MPVRQPRAWLSVDGRQVELIHCEVTISRDMMASTFIAKMALDHPTNPGAQFWSQAAPIPASIIATNDISFGQTGYKTIIEGQIDIIDLDWDKREVTVDGTDMMSQLSDTRSAQSFPNMKKSDVLQQILSKHGFNLHIDAVSEMAGKSWDGQDFSHITDNENELDVVHQLVESMGKTAFAVGRDFYVTDYGNVVGDTYPIVYKPELAGVPPELNGMILKTKRNVQLSSITSKAASYPPYEKQPATGGADEIPVGTPGSGSSGNIVSNTPQGVDEAGFQ